MTIPHEPWLVALSIAIAIQGSFVGLSLARELDSAEGFRRRLALAGSALTLATGVWSMHFVGMLAANFPSAIDYLVLPTLISFLICVIVVGVGVYAAHASGPPALRIASGASCDGARHQRDALCRHVGGASGRTDVVRAVLSSSPRSWSSIARQRLRPVGARQPADPAAAVPRRRRAGPGDFRHALHGDGGDAPRSAVLRRLALRRGRIGAVAQHARAARDGRLVRRLGRLSSLAGARRARPPKRRGRRRPTRRPPAAGRRARSWQPPPFAAAAAPARAAFVPVEKDGRGRELAVADIYAIRANAHYTYVHDGEQEYFCNLSISALEARLDPKAFLRVHRSYIVSVDRIARVKRSGEAGVAELGLPVRCSIPIARAHYRQVKLRIGALAG